MDFSGGLNSYDLSMKTVIVYYSLDGNTKQLSENGIKQPRIVARGIAAKWEEHRRVNLPIDHLAISFSTTKATI